MDELNREEFVESDFEPLKIYFGQTEWYELSVYEKQRFARIKKNYENLVEMGVNPAVPPFMVKKKRAEIANCSQTDSRKKKICPETSTIIPPINATTSNRKSGSEQAEGVIKNSEYDRGIAPSSSTRKRSSSEELKRMSRKPTVSRAVNSSDVPGDVNKYHLSQQSECNKHIRISTESDASEKSRFAKRDRMDCVVEDNLVVSDQNKQVSTTAKSRVLRKCHACPHCDYKTTNTAHLRRHIAVHEGIRPYKCQLCDYRTTQAVTLRTHVDAVHDGKKPYKCQHCDYRASQAVHLRIHVIAVHEGKKPYKCQHCDYRASQSSHLRDHVAAVHEGKKPHPCPLCDYRATHSSHVLQHVRAVHERMKPYGCRICDYRTSRTGDFRRHVKTVHGVKENTTATKV